MAAAHFCHQRHHLLIAEPVLGTAVRALPGDTVAGKSPYIFIHAILTDVKTAAALPAEAKLPAAAMAWRRFLPPAPAGTGM